MSAFIVDKAHINLLVNAGLNVRYKPMHYYHEGESRPVNDETADELGQMLLEQNIKSVMDRYQDSVMTNLPGRTDAEYLIPFKLQHDYEMPSVVQVLKAIDCYEYQACESDDWEETAAYTYCQSLRKQWIDKLPGYDAAEWDWSRWPSGNIIRII